MAGYTRSQWPSAPSEGTEEDAWPPAKARHHRCPRFPNAPSRGAPLHGLRPEGARAGWRYWACRVPCGSPRRVGNRAAGTIFSNSGPPPASNPRARRQDQRADLDTESSSSKRFRVNKQGGTGVSVPSNAFCRINARVFGYVSGKYALPSAASKIRSLAWSPIFWAKWATAFHKGVS
jgi:hypothetical protein